MKLYKDELAIAELILENNSIAYCVDVEPVTEENTSKEAIASIFDRTPNTQDLFPVKSILVTTNKNKNDDVFLPAEVWKAKATPVDKMWNIEHDHKRIVGHITSTWAIDTDHNIIAEDTSEDNLPPLFHVVSAGVIYAKWTDVDLQAMADELIEEIQQGQWKTSMEAWFNDFSFAAYRDDEFKIIERNEATAFLTKKLRCYGGDGLYDGYNIARVLKNITFSGNSLVRNPANPDSIILAENKQKNEKIVNFTSNSGKSGVYIKCNDDINQEKIMSDNILEKQVAELKETIKALEVSNKELSDKLASASTEKLEKEIESLKAEAATHAECMEHEKKKKKEMADANEALTKELESLKAKYDEAQSALNEMQVAALKSERVQKLVEAGLSKEDAEAKAESLVSLTNEQFDAVASALSLVKPVKVEATEDEKATKADEELAEAEDEVTDEIEGSATDTADESEEVLAAVASYFGDKLNSKEKK